MNLNGRLKRLEDWLGEAPAPGIDWHEVASKLWLCQISRVSNGRFHCLDLGESAELVRRLNENPEASNRKLHEVDSMLEADHYAEAVAAAIRAGEIRLLWGVDGGLSPRRLRQGDVKVSRGRLSNVFGAEAMRRMFGRWAECDPEPRHYLDFVSEYQRQQAEAKRESERTC